MSYWTGNKITKLEPNHIFVFGSNPEGRHGMGAAKQAMQFGATYGIGRGLSGQTYALPTKNLKAGFIEKETGILYPKQGSRSISLEDIRKNVLELFQCALLNPSYKFIVVYKSSSKNLNGYSSNEIINQFREAPCNIVIHKSFKPTGL